MAWWSWDRMEANQRLDDFQRRERLHSYMVRVRVSLAVREKVSPMKRVHFFLTSEIYEKAKKLARD